MPKPINFLTAAMTATFTLAVAWHASAQEPTPPPAKRLPPATAPLDDQPAAKSKSTKSKPKPKTPLDLVMKDGIPAHAAKRAILRDDLYALLATAGTPKEAKLIAAQIERVWRTSGSDTVAVLLSRATRALRRKDEKLALALLDSVVDLAPDHADAWNRRAFVHYKAKNYRAAVGDLRRALALDKNHYKALDGLASIFQQIGDETKALKVYEQLREIHPHWPDLEKAITTLRGKVRGRGI